MKRLAIPLFLVALLAAACGDSSEVVEDASPAAEAATTTVAPPTTAAPPTTTAPTTTAAPATTAAPQGITPGEDPDVDAIVLAYQIAFDSTSDYATKAPYIDDPTGLEETVVAYLETGETFNGVAVVATGVTVDGDTAAVAYDLYFGGNPTYPDLAGTAVKTADGWKVPRADFCSLMRSARVGCPSG